MKIHTQCYIHGYFQQWWREGDSNMKGTCIENLPSNLELSQLITEPTQDNSEPSSIDLYFCDQPV